ncbi:hypothetical protein PITCH_A2030224 [uncultured Desulfobacterium sp.]|uniref:histidine kinase n=1 Tax=uncultured Desulfobacterium sp. TaxID=201089 RepID=A0A445MX70_9BACT|nr:hypothetical protein PITCH_A2030224 [uncultured Desulfobacterium sp.]
MGEDLIYNELRQRIKTLEKEVSELNHSKKLLQESETTYRMLLDNSSVPITYFNLAGNTLFLNRVCAANLGGVPHDFIGRSIYEILPVSAEIIRKRISKVVETGTGSEYEDFVKLASGDYWFISDFLPVRNENGDIFAIQVVSRDITESKKIEKQATIFQKFVEASEQGLGMADLNGDLTYANPTLCSWFGEATPADAIGKNVINYYTKEDRQKLENECIPTVIREGHWVGELDIVSIQGKVTQTIHSVFLIRDKAGKPICLANVLTDITGHKRLEKVLMHREKLKTLGVIAAEVAHEIRNPLVSIGGFAQRLKQKFPDSQECDIILKESQRLEKILSRIKNYLEPIDFHSQECSVNTIITECLNLLSPETEQRQVQCILELTPNLPAAYADPEIMVQIVINLILSAFETMDKGGTLDIKTFAVDKEICIEFRNQAPDLIVKNPEVLFMPFAEGGRSIGLPLCYRWIKDMGGLLSFTQGENFIVFKVALPEAPSVELKGQAS